MSCHRLRRELVDAVRFGGGLLRAGPHLDHLERCRACREEVSFDRELVSLLRRTLRERVGEADPSPEAWTAVVRGIAAPERGLLGWFRSRSALILARLRTATAVSATTLAVLVATGTQATITDADPVPSNPRSTLGDWFERQPVVARGSIPSAHPAVVYVAPPPSDPEQVLIQSALLLSPVAAPETSESAAEEAADDRELVFDLGPGAGRSPLDDADSDEPGGGPSGMQRTVRGSPGGEPR
jgi:hypothetical protein